MCFLHTFLYFTNQYVFFGCKYKKKILAISINRPRNLIYILNDMKTVGAARLYINKNCWFIGIG